MSAVLSINNLTKTFPGVTALDDLCFQLRSGEIHAVCGENGAGKSTLIKCISGIWPSGSFDGEIELADGTPAKFTGIKDSEAAAIAVIYQELALVDSMTVAENVFLGREPRNGILVDWETMYGQCQKLLNEYELTLNPSDQVSDLGVGQQQLVEIVKALSKDAKILLLDEPTSALTNKEVKTLLKIIKSLKAKGISCIYISHKLDEVLDIADSITVIRDGKSIASKPRSEWTYESIVAAMVGREIDDLFPRRQTAVGDVLFEVRDLTAGFLKDISFDVKAGEVLGIGGLMGAGRSELLMLLFNGDLLRQSGSVKLKGQDHNSPTARSSIDNGLIMVTEDRKKYGLVLDESISFNMSLANLTQFVRAGLVDSYQEMSANNEFAQALRVKTPDLSNQVSGLSGGNQQKVVLAKAMMTEPDVIFLDEPTRGIDVGAKVEVYELINQLTADGKAVVMVSSEMPELIGMSDRILILSNGQLAGEFDSKHATQEQLLQAAMKHC